MWYAPLSNRERRGWETTGMEWWRRERRVGRVLIEDGEVSVSHDGPKGKVH